MKKIETLEDLVAERKRLNAVAEQMEDDLQEDFRYFSNHIQPLLSIFDGSSLSGKMPSLLLKGASTILPLLLSSKKAKAAMPIASPWATLGTAALGLLAGGQANGVVTKLSELFRSFGKKKKARKRRHHHVYSCTK